MQPGDVVRVSAMSCNDKPVSAPDYSHYFVEGGLLSPLTSQHVWRKSQHRPSSLATLTDSHTRLGIVSLLMQTFLLLVL